MAALVALLLVYLFVLLGHESSWQVRRSFIIIKTVSLLALGLNLAVPIVSLRGLGNVDHRFYSLLAFHASKSWADSIHQNIHVPILQRCCILTALISLLGDQEFLSLLC